MHKGIVALLCEESDLNRERKGYYKAFKDLGIEVVCVGDVVSFQDHPVFQEKDLLLVIQPEASFSLPLDMFSLDVPVAGFQIDTNHATNKRIKASSFFDIIFVFHPHYDELFKQGGHSHAFLLPHAIEKDLYQEIKKEKTYQIGWVGRTDGDNYARRRKILPLLREKYRMNDPFRHYTQEELLDIYKSSEIIVNIAKDDYLEDANLRCFEAMASGALLFTYLPSELTDLGFVEGEHFIGFSSEMELLKKIDYFLSHQEELADKAAKARELVLGQHNYHNRVERIKDIVNSSSMRGKARHWTPDKQKESLVYYFAFRRCFSKAYLAFKEIGFSMEKIIAFSYLLKLFVSKKLHNEPLS